jgi:hypothetical protein
VSSRRRWWLIAGAVVLVWVVVAGFLLVRAARDLQAGKDAALAARDALDASTIASGEPLPELREARRRFASASSKTGSVVLAPMRVLPIIGRQVRSVHSLSGAARDVTGSAVRALERAQQVLDDPASGGPARVRQIRSLRDAVADAQQEVGRVSLGPRDGLLGPLADARNELGDELAEATETLDDAVAGADAGLRLLEGPRDYLLVAANNARCAPVRGCGCRAVCSRRPPAGSRSATSVRSTNRRRHRSTRCRRSPTPISLVDGGRRGSPTSTGAR